MHPETNSSHQFLKILKKLERIRGLELRSVIVKQSQKSPFLELRSAGPYSEKWNKQGPVKAHSSISIQHAYLLFTLSASNAATRTLQHQKELLFLKRGCPYPKLYPFVVLLPKELTGHPSFVNGSTPMQPQSHFSGMSQKFQC